MTTDRNDPGHHSCFEFYYQARDVQTVAGIEVTAATAAVAAATDEYTKLKALERLEHAQEKKRQADRAIAETSVRRANPSIT